MIVNFFYGRFNPFTPEDTIELHQMNEWDSPSCENTGYKGVKTIEYHKSFKMAAMVTIIDYNEDQLQVMPDIIMKISC